MNQEIYQNTIAKIEQDFDINPINANIRKQPIEEGYNLPFNETKRTARSNSFRIGFQPGDHGLVVVDVDFGPTQPVIELLGDPISIAESSTTPGRHHLYYNAGDLEHSNRTHSSTFEVRDSSTDEIVSSGEVLGVIANTGNYHRYAVIHSPEATYKALQDAPEHEVVDLALLPLRQNTTPTTAPNKLQEEEVIVPFAGLDLIQICEALCNHAEGGRRDSLFAAGQRVFDNDWDPEDARPFVQAAIQSWEIEGFTTEKLLTEYFDRAIAWKKENHFPPRNSSYKQRNSGEEARFRHETTIELEVLKRLQKETEEHQASSELLKFLDTSHSYDDILSAKPMNWLVPNLLVKGVNLISADAKTGKTTIILSMLEEINSEGTWLGQKVEIAPIKCVYFSQEIPSVMQEHFNFLKDNARSLKKDVRFLFHHEFPICSTEFLLTMLEKKYIEVPEEERPHCFVFDTATEWLDNKDGNNIIETAKAFQPFRRLEAKTGISIVIIHHLSRTGNVHGSVGYETNPDWLVGVTEVDKNIPEYKNARILNVRGRKSPIKDTQTICYADGRFKELNRISITDEDKLVESMEEKKEYTMDDLFKLKHGLSQIRVREASKDMHIMITESTRKNEKKTYKIKTIEEFVTTTKLQENENGSQTALIKEG